MLGTIGCVLGMSLATAAAFIGDFASLCIWTGLSFFAIGTACFASSWFALMDGVVPATQRGRFWAKLRSAWQSLAIVFTLVVAVVMRHADSVISTYGLILLLVSAGLIIRTVLYRLLPESTNPPDRQRQGFLSSILTILRLPNYTAFGAYVFLLYLCIGAIPSILGLLEVEIGFSTSAALIAGTLLQVGAVAGFILGRHMVDRYGTKLVFLICHFGFALALALPVLRDILPVPHLAILCLASLSFGMLHAASSIAMTSEMMGIVPEFNKALAIALIVALQTAGMALSPLIASLQRESGIRNPSWQFFGHPLTNFDSLLLFASVAVILLVVTLGLVPSVITKSQWYPKSAP